MLIKAPRAGLSLPKTYYLCVGALYRLRTQPRIYQQESAAKLRKHNVVRAKADLQVFFGRDGNIYAVRVDHLIYTGESWQ